MAFSKLLQKHELTLTGVQGYTPYIYIFRHRYITAIFPCMNYKFTNFDTVDFWKLHHLICRKMLVDAMKLRGIYD